MDNGTNFAGTSNALKAIDREISEEFTIKKKFQWKYNPPSALWWREFWRKSVRIVRSVFRKVPGKVCVNEAETDTIICNAKSLINCRPLTYLTEISRDLIALSPSTFLQEVREIGILNFDWIPRNYKKMFIYWRYVLLI